jgi:hypothetical protein
MGVDDELVALTRKVYAERLYGKCAEPSPLLAYLCRDGVPSAPRQPWYRRWKHGLGCWLIGRGEALGGWSDNDGD